MGAVYTEHGILAKTRLRTNPESWDRQAQVTALVPCVLLCQPHLSALAALAGCTNGHGLAARSDLIRAADRTLLLPALALPEAQDARINPQDVTDTVLLCLSSSPARCELSQGLGRRPQYPGPGPPSLLTSLRLHIHLRQVRKMGGP